MEWLGGNTHSFLFPQKFKFSLSPKLGGIRGNEVRFNEFFTNSQNTPTLFWNFTAPSSWVNPPQEGHRIEHRFVSAGKKIFRNIHKSPSSLVQIILESLKKKKYSRNMKYNRIHQQFFNLGIAIDNDPANHSSKINST